MTTKCFTRVGAGRGYEGVGVGEIDPTYMVLLDTELAMMGVSGSDIHNMRAMLVGQAYTCRESYTWVRIR